jgi:diguanylate cyclase (GGDEF)-like protein/PAS domain S-box-containing protein
MFQHSLDGVMFTAPDGRVLAANRAACDLLAMTEEEIIAAGRPGLADPTDDRWIAAVDERRKHGRARAELRMRRGDGSVFIADIASVVFETESGERSCVILRDVTDRVRMLERLSSLIQELGQLALVDELTGLRNRRGFGVAAETALAIADRQDVPVHVLFIDVDGMKRINDEHGHDVGDRALTDVAAALRDSMRSTDIAGRMGGDEFVVLLHDATSEEADRVATRFTEALAERRTLGTTGISASIGIANRRRGDSDLARLLSNADRRMYAAKGASRSFNNGKSPI